MHFGVGLAQKQGGILLSASYWEEHTVVCSIRDVNSDTWYLKMVSAEFLHCEVTLFPSAFLKVGDISDVRGVKNSAIGKGT